MDINAILIEFAQALLPMLLLGGLAVAFPYRKKVALWPLTAQEAKAVQHAVEQNNWLALVLMFTVMPFISWLAYDFLKAVFALFPPPSGAFTYRFQFDELFWLFPGVLFGIGAGMPVMAVFSQLFYGREKYALIVHAYNEQYGFDHEVATRWMMRLFVGSSLVFVLLCYTCYAGVQGKEVVINPMLELRERRYAFEEIKRISFVDYRMVKENNQTDRLPYYEMEFRDGFVWDTREFLRNVPITEDQPLIEYLAKQTQLPIDSIEKIETLTTSRQMRKGNHAIAGFAL